MQKKQDQEQQEPEQQQVKDTCCTIWLDFGIGTDRAARRRPAAAAARCAGRARGGRQVTGRGARMTGIRRQEAQSEQAAALLAGSLISILFCM